MAQAMEDHNANLYVVANLVAEVLRKRGGKSATSTLRRLVHEIASLWLSLPFLYTKPILMFLSIGG